MILFSRLVPKLKKKRKKLETERIKKKKDLTDMQFFMHFCFLSGVLPVNYLTYYIIMTSEHYIDILDVNCL